MVIPGYTIDDVHRTVTDAMGTVVRLEPKTYDLLLYFIAHAGEMLSKERLIAEVWNGKFVTDDAVTVAVYALRRAFHDDARVPRFIETVRGRGYRWIAPLATPAPAPRRLPTTIGAACLAAVAFTTLIGVVHRQPRPMPTIDRTKMLVRAHARGVFFSERRTLPDLKRALAELRAAIALDDRFAEPHAALAEVCVSLVEMGAAEYEQEARREAARALALAPELALAHAANGAVDFVLDRDRAGAERRFRHAIALDPALPGPHRRYSYLLGATGRFREATEQARIAADLEPASSAALADLAWTHVLSGRLAEAERIYRDAARLDPASINAHFSLGYCLDLRNRPAEALDSYRRALQILGASVDDLVELDATYARAGLPGVYASWHDRFRDRAGKGVPHFIVAFYAARSGREAEAIASLRESMARREPAALWVSVHPAFASLRGQRGLGTIAAGGASSFQIR